MTLLRTSAGERPSSTASRCASCAVVKVGVGALVPQSKASAFTAAVSFRLFWASKMWNHSRSNAFDHESVGRPACRPSTRVSERDFS